MEDDLEYYFSGSSKYLIEVNKSRKVDLSDKYTLYKEYSNTIANMQFKISEENLLFAYNNNGTSGVIFYFKTEQDMILFKLKYNL